MSTNETLTEIRAERRNRLSTVGVGILVGTLLGSIHWVGLFVGGAIAGLGQQSLLRGIGAGALTGFVIWLIFIATLQLHAAAFPALRSMPIVAVSLGIAVGYGAVGGLLRGVR